MSKNKNNGFDWAGLGKAVLVAVLTTVATEAGKSLTSDSDDDN